MSAGVRAGDPVSDYEFDAIYPDHLRIASAVHWTPVSVARRAALMLVDKPGARILDVGAGVGKFCLIGALTTPGVFVGVEQRRSLVEIARETAQAAGALSANYVHANAFHVEWDGFDGLYLYNPFIEHLFGDESQIDLSVLRSADVMRRHIAFTRRNLAAARRGTRVVTYHGFGDEPPEGYALKDSYEAGGGRLELWIKGT